MGSASSKFKKYLQHGDEYAAMQVYQNNPEIRKTLQPSFSYGDSYDHFTPLHYASRHGMKHLIRAFLNDLNGNPNKTNVYGQTALHCVCQVNQQKSLSALERRSYSVILLLSWRGPVMSNGERERVEVSRRDNFGFTALHYASKSGLKKCVEYLLAHGADLFVENGEGMTACDLAIKENHHHIALFLESKMVFSGTPESLSGESRPRTSSCEEGGSEEEVYSGLRAQDLQEAKDQLLVETADMLHIPLFTAEALLRHAEWSREALLDQWIRDPISACHLAGVQPPYTALRNSQIASTRGTPPDPPSNKPVRLADTEASSSFNVSIDTTLGEDEYLCEICCDLMDSDFSDGSLLGCRHKFCTTCWKNYLHTKIQEGNAHQIFCPAYDCSILVPVEVIERAVSPEMAKKYLKFDINAFVETNKSIKWCPYPGCNRAVNLPESERKAADLTGLPPTSHAVDCGAGHFFCFECGREAHAPIGCSAWRSWLSRVTNVNPSELKTSSIDYQDAANCLWLVTHSKPCPNCESPIQKTDGCNHIKCSKCRYDFCWVCLESWKKHSSITGGYFRCNRFVQSSDGKCEEADRLADKTKKLREMNRFIHFYTRYKNHENSRSMEESLLTSAKRKREILQSSLGQKEGSVKQRRSSTSTTEDDLGRNTKFYEDGVWELIKARAILGASYVYGFYLEDKRTDCKTIFEFMQNELEDVTERLSEMIARPYLRTPRKTIIRTIQTCRRKRQEFLKGAYRGFLPPEHSSYSRKSKEEDANEDPWIKQKSGSDDISGDVVASSSSHSSRYCRRPGCQRPRAMRHSRSGGSSIKKRSSTSRDWIEFCSMQCAERFHQKYYYRQKIDGNNDNDDDDDDDLNPDFTRNLTIALELSRMQMLRDGLDNVSISGRDRPSTLPRASRSDDSILVDDPQLNLAIELSLKDMKKKKQHRNNSYLVPPPPSSESVFKDKSPTFIEAANKTVNSFLKSLGTKDKEDDDAVKRSQSTGDIDEETSNDSKLLQSRDTEESSASTSTTLKEVGSKECSSIPQPVKENQTTTGSSNSRRFRPRFIRQKSFEIDSDSTDMEMSLTEDASSSHKTLDESATKSPSKALETSSKGGRYARKCPGLTIQIIKDDDDDEDEEEDEKRVGRNGSVLMPNKSPTIHISGVSISRTGPGTPDRQQNSPRTCSSTPYGAVISAVTAAASTVTAPAAASAASILAEATNRQHRSSSLIVPGQSTPPKSPGSRSLHLSRASSPSEIRLLTLPKNSHQQSATSTTSPQQPFSSVELPPTSPLTSVPSPHSAKSLKGDKFTFPSSSNLSAPLSSVLHVQDCYLSSDDFHEALFLEKSPKTLHKKRKKSKNHHYSYNGGVSKN